MNPWGWFTDLWSWAWDNGTVGAIGLAGLVTVFDVMITATALIWLLVGIKALAGLYTKAPPPGPEAR